MFALALAPLGYLVLGGSGALGLTLGADPVRLVTDTLGLWALRLLLATLAISPLAFVTHAPDWLRLRRMLGLFAFAYALLHFTMYIAVDQTFDFGVLGEDIVKRPWITLGATALACLIPLAATSTRAAMRRLGRRWQQLHYLVYPAALAACWHYYWQVKRDVRAPLAYAAVFAVLMGMRLLRRRLRGRAAAALLAQPDG